eukprot:TRINITY_DN13013_c0_g1_i1.p1 TRINITY_DN13013_c0_g1~~TRINITY_DN13013_c0_g1_i1.p1  ORF type:complete len:406 (+),score=71.85 TRINITY_DN13013_c0_g1_i1:64-1281(+)
MPGALPNATEKAPEFNNEILIDGVYYNVADFKKRHPGGSIIHFYTKGIDATDAYRAFHSRSVKADKFLSSLPSRKDPSAKLDSDTPLMKDFFKLRTELEKEGFFKPSPVHIAYRLIEIVLMHVLGIWLVHQGFYLPGIFILGIVQGRCGWLEHEAGHYSLTGNIKIDRYLQDVLYCVGCGMSSSWWRNQHNKHHAMPQKLEHDVDLNTLPLVAFNKEIGKKGSRPWLSLQAYLFSPLTCLVVALGWQFFLHPRHALRTKKYLELFLFGLRYASIYYLFSNFSASAIIFMYLGYMWVGAAYIFTNFAMSHTHLPVLKPDEHVDWVRFAGDFTVNLEPTLWCNWWMSYLNFQIEHHLFPSMPQFRHPIIAPRVKALFEKHGVPYVVHSYWDGLKITYSNLHHVGNSH